MDQSELKEVEEIYRERIQGWMIADLKTSIDAGTNCLTALGCLVYTEFIGIFLPQLKGEPKGRKEKIRFYRCFFRLPSSDYLKKIDARIIKETKKGIYENLRHNMAHIYFPFFKKG